MIRVMRRPLSAEARVSYEEKVLSPGRRWLRENASPTTAPTAPRARKSPPDYWRRIQPELAEAFQRRCVYTAIKICGDGVVDHFVSIDEDLGQAYEWDNFRYCTHWVNSRKRNLRSTQLLDPLEIEDKWFEIVLPSLELRVTERCPEPLRARAQFMLEKLGLANGERAMQTRRDWYEIYRPEDPQTLALLDEWAPLLSRAIRKQLQESTG